MTRRTVRECCARPVTTVEESKTLREAARAMKAEKIGSLIVVKDDYPIGIITERDFQDRAVADGVDIDRTTVGDVMATSLLLAAPDDPVADVVSAMQSKNIRHVPVVEGGRLFGLLSIRDVVFARDAVLRRVVREKTVSLQGSLRRQHNLVRFNKMINSTLDLDELLNIIDGHVKNMLGVGRYSLFLHGDNGLQLLRSGHLDAEKPMRIMPGCYQDSLLGDVIRDRRVKEIEDFHEDQYLHPEKLPVGDDAGWCLCAPLVHGGEVIGILNVSDKKSEMKNFTAAEMDYLSAVSDQISSALANCLAHRTLKETERRLAQQSKLASIGQLAAGVAHEINNPLEAISRYCQVVLADNGEASEERECLERILKETRRAAGIVRNLLTFSRRGEAERVTTDLRRILQDSLELSRSVFVKEGKVIVEELGPEISLVAGDPGELQQVFINMITNARQALAEGGTLRVARRLGRSKDSVDVIFEDDGEGIARENLKKIFDPFFTTKGVGEGMGLGLSICHGIVEKHGGGVEVQSREGVGTTFTVKLPTQMER